MFDFLKDLILGPGMYLLCFLSGMLFKRYVLDVIKNWVINRLKPGIIQAYLEQALGINQKQSLPPVVIMPVIQQAPAAKPVEVVKEATVVAASVEPIVEEAQPQPPIQQ